MKKENLKIIIVGILFVFFVFLGIKFVDKTDKSDISKVPKAVSIHDTIYVKCTRCGWTNPVVLF